MAASVGQIAKFNRRYGLEKSEDSENSEKNEKWVMDAKEDWASGLSLNIYVVG